MKKINKINLKLDKEVITSLSGNDLSLVKGGGVTGAACDSNGCIPAITKAVTCNPRTVLCPVSADCSLYGGSCVYSEACIVYSKACVETDMCCSPFFSNEPQTCDPIIGMYTDRC